MSDMALEEAYRIGMGEARARFDSALERLLYLRSLPNVAHLQGNGLTFIAQRAVERFFEDGAEIFNEDRPVDAVHFIVEGKARLFQDGVHLLDAESPFAVGFLSVLCHSPVHQRAVAVGDTVTLELKRHEIMEVFEDDFDFLETAIRQMTRQVLELQVKLESQNQFERSTPEPVPYPHGELDLVQRIHATRLGVLMTSNLEPVVQFARRVEEVRVEPGHVFWEEGTSPKYGLNIVYGVVECESSTRRFEMGPNSSIGYLDAYADQPRSYRAVATTKVVALRGTADDYFDILEDHVDLALAILGFIAEALIDLQNRVARLTATRAEPEEE